MKIVVASGKGGTGKTTVATSLALSLMAQNQTQTESSPRSVLFLDCDVEAPNAHLFLKPQFQRQKEVILSVPVVDETICTHCGHCAEVCQAHAISVLPQKVMVFNDLCSGCGSCAWNCPEHAITETDYRVGLLESTDLSSGAVFARGSLDIGRPMTVPVVQQLKRWLETEQNHHTITIIDAPPGSSCPVVASLRGVDYALLVTEPTPFGLHDLRLIVEVIKLLGLPAGVIINRDGAGEAAPLEQFCAAENLPILWRIPLKRAFGEGIAQAIPLIEIEPDYRPRFTALFDQIEHQVKATKL